jgi:hypothetical protein
MSYLRVYIQDLRREVSFTVHCGTGVRLASAINDKTKDLDSLLKSAYEFDRGVYDVNSRMDKEVSEESYEAGIIEIHFPDYTIISDQSCDYICHKGIRETWGYTGNHLDAGRFKRFTIPESWTIIDKYFFCKPTKIEGEIDREFERRLWERVDWYKRMGYKVEIV